jgi:hypothetical protein
MQGIPGVLPGAQGGNPQNINPIGANRVPGGIRSNVNANGLVVPNAQGLPTANIIQAQPPQNGGAPPTRKLRVINTR